MTVETGGGAAIDRGRVEELTERQMRVFAERTPRSKEYFERAKNVMPAGVPSSFQSIEPWPTYIAYGRGSHVWDVDGAEYVDFHNGFGVMCVGHANPTVVASVHEQAGLGTHFAAPTEGSIAVAEELRSRFGLPQWRFTNSGTESTMDAIHFARAATGRDVILKIEGSYNGHHDAVMVSTYPGLEELEASAESKGIPFGDGYPEALTDLTRVVPFNDVGALERVLNRLEGQVAGMIIEPVMMNINIIPPREGYLERVRELTTAHGAKLIFDEVKTGATIAAGGATERYGVSPDLITLAKACFGGFPGGAVGMTEDIGELIAEDKVHQYGTFNGNPLVMEAARATLLDVLVPEAYERLERTNAALLEGCDDVIERHGLPCYTEGMAAKGCVIFSREGLSNYRDYLTKVDEELSTLAWLYNMNRGIFMTPGAEEEWTLSVATDDTDVKQFVGAFEEFARDVTA